MAVVQESLPAGETVDEASIVEELRSPAHLAAVLRAIGVDPSGGDVNHLVQRVGAHLQLRIERPPASAQRTLVISYEGDDLSTGAAMLVNQWADDYLAAVRAPLEARARHELGIARDALLAAESDLDLAREQLDAWLQRRLVATRVEAAPAVDVAETTGEETAESPAQRELTGQLDDLVSERERLLKRMTPEHPDVKAIEVEIQRARDRLGGLAPRGRKLLVKSVHRPPQEEREVWSIAWDASCDDQWRALREAADDAERLAGELAAAESEAAARLDAVRTAELGRITPCTLAAPATAQNRRGELAVVGLCAALAALAASVGRRSVPQVAPHAATIESVRGVEMAISAGVLGVIEMGREPRSPRELS